MGWGKPVHLANQLLAARIVPKAEPASEFNWEEFSDMATWSLCTKFGTEQQKQKVFVNLDNVITVERLDDRTSVVFVN